MELRKFLPIIIYCIPCFAFAQQEFTVNGALYRKNTSDRIAQAVITNLHSNVIMMSDELGGFSIIAAKGDTLLVNKNEYSPQKVVVNSPNDLIIYLQPNLQLAEVTVKDKNEKQELNDVVNTYRSKGLYFDGRPPAWSFINSPLTGLYEIFSRDATNERHFIKFSKDEAQANEIDRRYTRQLVKQVTGLPDADVLKFMQQYRPSYEDMKQWNDYDLISHIKRYLGYYKKHKDDPALGPLTP